MKKNLLLFCFFMICIHHNVLFSQPCSVSIDGSTCTGNILTATFAGGNIGQLTWKQNGYTVFIADTVSSTTSISLVAGGKGIGSGANQFNFPCGGMALDAAGNIYVTDYNNNRIQKWAPGASAGVTVAGGNGVGAAANQLFHPKDVFVAANQDIYIADYGNNRIQRWSPGAVAGVTVAGGVVSGNGSAQLRGPSGVYVDAHLNIYIADSYNYRIQKWNHDAKTGITVAGGSFGAGASQLTWPIDVYLDSAKNIYIADADLENSDNHRIQKWALGSTSGTTVAGGIGTGSGPNQFGYLLAITVDAAGNLYAADNGVSGTPQSRIQKWAPGAVNGVTVAGGFGRIWDQLSYPTGVAVDNGGNIFVLDGTYNPRVQKYIPTNGIVTTTYIPSQPGDYAAEAIFKNGCTAVSENELIRAIPGKPQIRATTIGGRGSLCDGGTDTFFVYLWDEITTYTWMIPSQCTEIENKNDTIIIGVPANFSSGRLTVRGTNVCGTGVADTMFLLGKPAKSYKIFGPQSVFANQANIEYRVADKGNLYNWTVPAAATITSGQGTADILVHWGTEAGIISVNSSNACGTSKTTEQYVALKGNIFTDAQPAGATNNNTANKTTVLITPNPASGIATLIINTSVPAKYRIQLQDLSGKVLIRQENILTAGVNKISMDISKYPPGVYLLNLVNPANEKISLKLVKE